MMTTDEWGFPRKMTMEEELDVMMLSLALLFSGMFLAGLVICTLLGYLVTFVRQIS